MNNSYLNRINLLVLAPFVLSLMFVVGCSSNQHTEPAPNNNQQMTDKNTDVMRYPVYSRRKILKIERTAPETTRAGVEYPYTLKISNVSDSPAHSIVLRERGNFNILDAKALSRLDDDNQYDVKNTDNGRGWSVGHLKAGESKTIKMIGLAQEEGTLRSCLGVDFQCSHCHSIDVVTPRLQLTRSFEDGNGNAVSSVYPCDDVHAVYNIENNGSGASDDVHISETFMNGMGADGNGNLSLNPGIIEPGDSVNKRMSLAFTEPGTYEGRATAKSGDVEVYSDTDRLKVMKPTLKLDVEGSNEVFVDRTVTHRVTVKNTSDDPAKESYVEVDIPEGAQRVSTSLATTLDENGRLDIGHLDAGESRSFDITFEASKPTNLTTQVRAGAYCAETKLDRAQTDVKGVPAIGMELVDTKDPVRTGETTSYLINIKNQGSAPDSAVRLVGELPEGVEFLSAEGETEVSMKDGSLHFEVPSTLQPGKSFTWEVKVRALKQMSAYFTLKMTSSANTRAVTEEEATNIVD